MVEIKYNNWTDYIIDIPDKGFEYDEETKTIKIKAPNMPILLGNFDIIKTKKGK